MAETLHSRAVEIARLGREEDKQTLTELLTSPSIPPEQNIQLQEVFYHNVAENLGASPQQPTEVFGPHFRASLYRVMVRKLQSS
jgi:hypothetical protein